jgi:hypothetical protein
MEAQSSPTCTRREVNLERREKSVGLKIRTGQAPSRKQFNQTAAFRADKVSECLGSQILVVRSRTGSTNESAGKENEMRCTEW